MLELHSTLDSTTYIFTIYTYDKYRSLSGVDSVQYTEHGRNSNENVFSVESDEYRPRAC